MLLEQRLPRGHPCGGLGDSHRLELICWAGRREAWEAGGGLDWRATISESRDQVGTCHSSVGGGLDWRAIRRSRARDRRVHLPAAAGSVDR